MGDETGCPECGRATNGRDHTWVCSRGRRPPVICYPNGRGFGGVSEQALLARANSIALGSEAAETAGVPMPHYGLTGDRRTAGLDGK